MPGWYCIKPSQGQACYRQRTELFRMIAPLKPHSSSSFWVMNLQRYVPTDRLKPFIKAFLIIESDTGTQNRVVPDTSMVLSFRYRGSVTDGSEGRSLPSSVISGIRKSARLLVYAPQTANLLVIFQEGGAAAFFREPLHELFGQSLSLDMLIQRKHLADTEEQLAEAKTNRQRIDLVEQFLLARMGHSSAEPLITHAIDILKTSHGNTRVKTLAESLWLSQDAFEKRFRRAVGTTPKQFAAIVRFRHLLNARSPQQRLTELAYASGYFDQAHFIRDFRSFTGQTPHDFFKSAQYW